MTLWSGLPAAASHPLHLVDVGPLSGRWASVEPHGEHLGGRCPPDGLSPPGRDPAPSILYPAWPHPLNTIKWILSGIFTGEVISGDCGKLFAISDSSFSQAIHVANYPAAATCRTRCLYSG